MQLSVLSSKTEIEGIKIRSTDLGPRLYSKGYNTNTNVI